MNFFISTDLGFVCASSDHNVFFNKDVRLAKPFDSFTAADDFAKHIINNKQYKLKYFCVLNNGY